MIPPAPLLYSLLEWNAWRTLVTLATYAHTRHTKELFDDDIRRNQVRRLNAFARLEIELWGLAAEGGHQNPPPYAVRYDLARWLWHPSINGAIFCLRCGDELEYIRRDRTRRPSADPDAGSTRTGRCRTCSRGREDDWPDRALEPYGRGTWLLHCSYTGCAQPFVGRRQARHCERHPLSRLTPSARKVAT